MKNELKEKKFKAFTASLGHGLILSYKEWPHLKKANLKGRLTMVSETEIGTTYKRKRNGCHGDDIPWKGNHNDVESLEVKPHFFPLSCLTKEIVVEGYNDNNPFYADLKLGLPPLIKNVIITTKNDMEIMKHLSNLRAWQIELLYQWHFNVFNLPPDSYINAAESKVYEPK